MFLEITLSKSLRYIGFIACLGAVLISSVSCKKESSEYIDLATYEKSYEIWLQFKKDHQNSYQYTTTSGPSFVGGYDSETRVVVKNGIVKERHFQYQAFYGVKKPSEGWNDAAQAAILQSMQLTAEEFQRKYRNTLKDELEWIEKGDEVGKKEFTPASAAWSLDRVYDWSKRIITDKQYANDQVIFETKNAGMISRSGVLLSNCIDDCFNGLQIIGISPIQ